MIFIRKRLSHKFLLVLVSFVAVYWLVFLNNGSYFSKQYLFESVSLTYQGQREDSRPKVNVNDLEINLPPISHGNFTNKDFYKSLIDARLVFVGGYARSGTTLMRAILDVHKSIYCGPETKIVPTILDFFTKYKTKSQNIRDLQHAGINSTQLNLALASFIYSIMENHGEKVPRLCAKDPDVLYYMSYLHELFPLAKFIFMVRDGRAAAYSLLDRLKEQKTFNRYKAYLTTWNSYNRLVNTQCKKLGKEFCLVVKYEQLILHPRETIQGIMSFLNEEFSEDLLNHQKYIGDRIKVSQTEWSTDQIMKPINTKSLTTWIDNLVEGYDPSRLKYIMPMLAEFNYSIEIDALDYRKEVADANVRENDKKLKASLSARRN